MGSGLTWPAACVEMHRATPWKPRPSSGTLPRTQSCPRYKLKLSAYRPSSLQCPPCIWTRSSVGPLPGSLGSTCFSLSGGNLAHHLLHIGNPLCHLLGAQCCSQIGVQVCGACPQAVWRPNACLHVYPALRGFTKTPTLPNLRRRQHTHGSMAMFM